MCVMEDEDWVGERRRVCPQNKMKHKTIFKHFVAVEPFLQRQSYSNLSWVEEQLRTNQLLSPPCPAPEAPPREFLGLNVA